MKEFLINRFQITEDEANGFYSAFVNRDYKKNEHFITQGKVCHEIGFLEKGLIKCAYMDNANEVIDDFVFENNFVTNYYSFLKQTPSSKNLICLEDCSIKVVNRERLHELAQKYPFMEQMGREIAEGLFLSTHEKLESLRLKTAEQRYLELLDTNKVLFEKIPQYEIASYLNVTPETVSRIRKQLMNRS